MDEKKLQAIQLEKKKVINTLKESQERDRPDGRIVLNKARVVDFGCNRVRTASQYAAQLKINYKTFFDMLKRDEQGIATTCISNDTRVYNYEMRRFEERYHAYETGGSVFLEDGTEIKVDKDIMALAAARRREFLNLIWPRSVTSKLNEAMFKATFDPSKEKDGEENEMALKIRERIVDALDKQAGLMTGGGLKYAPLHLKLLEGEVKDNLDE